MNSNTKADTSLGRCTCSNENSILFMQYTDSVHHDLTELNASVDEKGNMVVFRTDQAIALLALCNGTPSSIVLYRDGGRKCHIYTGCVHNMTRQNSPAQVTYSNHCRPEEYHASEKVL